MFRVVRRFNDRKTGERYEVGQEYKGARAEHLQARGFVVREDKEESACEPVPSIDE